MRRTIVDFFEGLLGVVLVFGALMLLLFFMGANEPTTPATMGEPAYDPACVIESPTMGCVDEEAYDQSIDAAAELESASSPDPGDSSGRFGWP